MELSPFSQYYLRKMLNQHEESIAHPQPNQARSWSDKHLLVAKLQQFQRTAQPESQPNSIADASDLSQLLAKVQSTSLDAPTRRELETLLQMYQSLESKIAFEYESLSEIKRRIFRLLGLRISAFAATGIPTIIQEKAVRPFWFHWSNNLREGVHYSNDLYGMVREFNILHRSQAYQLAWALAEQKIPALLTASETRYVIWVCLRSPASAVLMQQASSALGTILSLHNMLRNCRSEKDL